MCRRASKELYYGNVGDVVEGGMLTNSEAEISTRVGEAARSKRSGRSIYNCVCDSLPAKGHRANMRQFLVTKRHTARCAVSA